MERKFFPFSPSTIFAAIFAVLSASFTRQLMDFAEGFLGGGGFRNLIYFLLIGTAAAFFFGAVKVIGLNRPLRVIILAAVLLLTFFFAWKIKLPQVRMHILIYAVLAWLSARDAARFGITKYAILAAWLFASAAGILEESFQKVLPYRYFDIEDIFFNVSGATLGVALFLIVKMPGRRHFNY